jgi:phosphotransferase system enzyme I (PtsI)
VIVNPSPIVLEEYRFRQRQSELERARLSRLRHTPAVTLDGEHIELLANIELPADAERRSRRRTGVGLFRSEFLFMNREGELPSEEEQFEACAAVEAMKGMPVTIRTVDVGADKPLDRLTINDLRHEHVLNPAMGLRAIRWSLAEPSMFRQQLRAIYRAQRLRQGAAADSDGGPPARCGRSSRPCARPAAAEPTPATRSRRCGAGR